MTRNIRATARPSRKAWLAGSSALAGGLVLVLASSAYALPTGGEIAAGAASIAGGPGGLTITQSSQNAAINWQSFSIGHGEAVTFVQPNASAVALNRVLGSDPSTILGSLNANGRVFLVNPNGVLFGAGSRVNVGGLVASTLGTSDSDFMAGRYSFTGAGGTVLNQGAIDADGGVVALLGGKVSNEGVITARLGAVALAAGDAVTLDFAGDGLLNVAIDRGAVGALAQNGGLIRADGGQVVLSARAAGGLLKTVVNNTGAIEARTLENRNGVIRLLGDGGAVTVSGRLDATGLATGQTGGLILVTGQAVELGGHARLDASGDSGGGAVLVGGDYQGRNPAIANAQSVTMGRDAAIAVDATQTGHGGKAILWSDGLTQALGTISARGGAVSGDGGFVETSGLHVLTGDGTRVDTRAAHGATGLWLLDPVDYTIAGAGGDETPAQVTTSLALSDRLITATHNITVGSVISWSTSQTLTLDAGNDIAINAAINASGPNSRLVLIAGRDLTIAGVITDDQAGAVLRFRAGRDMAINSALNATGAGAVVDLGAGHNVRQSAAITSSGGGAVTMTADNDGTGGIGGGTVILDTPAQVTADALHIFYSPENGYALPNSYAGVIVPAGQFSAQMWAFATAANKVYDGTTAATLTFAGDPTAGGVNAVALAGGATFVDKNVGSLKAVNVAGATLTGADAADFALFSGGAGQTASITPATLTITANSAAKTYGQVITFAGGAFTSVGLVAGETIGGVTETSPGAAASANVAGAPYVITPANAVGGTFSLANYTTTYVNGLLTVAPAPLLLTPNNAAKTYGQTLTFTGSEFASTGLQNGDTVGTVTLASAGAAATAGVAPGPYAITASNAVGGSYTPGNYAITYGTGAITVVPAALVVTANNATKTYGQTVVFAGTAFTIAGLANGETAGTATESSVGAVATAAVGASPYAIAVSSLSGGTFTAANYVTTYVPGALTVTPAVLTVTANDASKAFGDTLTFTGQEFTTAGLVNGETVGAVSLTSPGAASSATPSGVTPYAITASAATGGTFTPGNYATSYVAGDLTVNASGDAINAAGGAINQVSGGSGFTPNGGSEGVTVPTATEVAERERERNALEGGGSGLAQAVAGPAGAQMAVLGDGVRMPAIAAVEHAQQADARVIEAQQAAPLQAAPLRAPAEAAPVRARKQDRN